MKYQIYGSESSIDTDLMVFVESLGNIDENKKMIEKCKTKLQSKFKKEIDVHLAVVKDGMVVDVSHGTYDECNNSLYETYKLHKQEQDNIIESKYNRIDTDFMHLKMIRISRFILSFFSRKPELRQQIKSALRGDFKQRLDALKLIDFTKYTTFPGKIQSKEDIYKVIAFQFAQILGLLSHIEIYSKEDVYKWFPELSKYIKRKTLDTIDIIFLNVILKHFIHVSESEIPKMKTLT
jgi:hypothetical protein